MNSQAHRCTEALQGHLDVPDDSLSHQRYQRSTSTSPNTPPGVAAASNISSPGAAAHDPPLPLTPLRLESIRADRQSPLMPRQPSGHSLARLKHSQSSMLRLGACREQRRWSAGTYRCWSLPGDARCPWPSLAALLAPHLFAPRPLVPPSFGRPSKRTLRRLRHFRGPRFFFLEPATTKRSRKIAEP